MAPPNTENCEASEKHVLDAVSLGFLLPCIALGSKLGLFDKMAAFAEAKTSQEIVDAMSCKQRLDTVWQWEFIIQTQLHM